MSVRLVLTIALFLNGIIPGIFSINQGNRLRPVINPGVARMTMSTPKNVEVGSELTVVCTNLDASIDYASLEIVVNGSPIITTTVFNESSSENESLVSQFTTISPEYRDRVMVRFNKTYLDPNVTMMIVPNRGDTGVYQCRYFYSNGRVETSNSNLILVVRPTGVPQITISSSLVNEGDTVIVSCACDGGFPLGTQRMLRGDGTPVDADWELQPRGQDMWIKMTYNFTAKETDNNEQFKCVSYNDVNPVPKEVMSKPPMDVKYACRRAVVTPRKDVYQPMSQVFCQSSGNPVPIMKWRKVLGPGNFSIDDGKLVIGNVPGFYLYECVGYNVVAQKRKMAATMLSFRVPSSHEGTIITDGGSTRGKYGGGSDGGGSKNDYGGSDWPNDKIALVAGGTVMAFVCCLAFVIVIVYIIWQRRNYKTVS